MTTTLAPPTIDLTQVTTAYVNIRNARSAMTREFEAKDTEFKDKLATLEGVMLAHLNAHSMESVRTDAGTFYRQEDIKPSMSDDKAFYAWIREHDAFDALERRVKKTFIKEYMDAHDGAMPPGISVHREYVVRVRKPS